MPTEALQQKALQYVNKDMISEEMASRVIQAIVQERGHASILNDDEQHQPTEEGGRSATSTSDHALV